MSTQLMKSAVGLAVAGLMVAGLIAPGAASAATRRRGASGCADVVVSLRTFHVEMASHRRAYRPGQTAKIEVTVTRPAAEDPLGLGIGVEPAGEVPAEDVGVGVGIRAGDAFLTGSERTDEEGLAVIEIALPKKNLAKGPVEASGFGWETWWRGGCLIVEEWGHRKEPKLFRIRGG